ncbi:Angiotensin-converting enzyme-like protein [Argiope bruennichi]|uniref:Angiotensin-converting enzyme n=2 Tax=Argiope bruennichi TaxID=94029 RepID=A0A8T0FVI1_ARGBR|nr:Angiotensin-converting enzyme-like protein [Argiope bruennichi]
MAEIFSKAKICSLSGKCDIAVNDVSKVFADTRDPKELKHYWLEFRKATGEKYRDLFLEAIKKDNKAAARFGFPTRARLNIARYEDKNFLRNMALEMRKILPFYKQIHAYIRKKLRKYYKNENIQWDGPIPAHLLGDMYAQKWSHIFRIVKPYPKSSGLPNVTRAMRKKKMEQIDMFMMAEKFFTSLGMKKMTPQFWHYSLMKKPEDRVIDCHASAHNFNDGKDFRIKMCPKVDVQDLQVIHHEMGHIEYYMHYNHLPFLFRAAPNPGFHEAIGDAIVLSFFTPSYLRQVGLLKRKPLRKDYAFTINYLLDMALKYAVSVPYDYIIDHWRNKVYEGIIKDTELNGKYWDYRLRFQGVCPPSKRTEKNFDIGAKWHIAGGVEYFRYYVANIFQFQMYKILCVEAGHKGPLHQCNLYRSKKAGLALANFLSKGRSRNWKILLHSFSRGAYRKIDASAMLEYFDPLIKWLKKKNVNEHIGWRSDDPMSCPGYEESTDDDSATTVPVTTEATDKDVTDIYTSDTGTTTTHNNSFT